jgi:hypothetical protein
MEKADPEPDDDDPTWNPYLGQWTGTGDGGGYWTSGSDPWTGGPGYGDRTLDDAAALRDQAWEEAKDTFAEAAFLDGLCDGGNTKACIAADLEWEAVDMLRGRANSLEDEVVRKGGKRSGNVISD